MKRKVTATAVLLLSLFTLQSQVSKKKSQKELNNILGANEAKAINDQVFADDVIIDGSLCVGLDCVNGESFGFDTERLKENNVRLHFDDTSSSASFPANDWRIIINDSSNGGANYFAIEDATSGRVPFRVEAGAPSNALYVESDGDIGIKTANPVVDLHIVEGNTPTVRLEQDGSSGFTPQTWDVAGNEAGFFIRDATNGSTLPFRIRPGSPSNSLHIQSGGVYVKNAILPASSIPSDARLKISVSAIADATNVILQMMPRTYFYKSQAIEKFGLSERKQFGLIAQELEEVLPELVTDKPFDEDEYFKTIDYSSLIPILIQGFKEQEERIRTLEEELKSMTSLEKRIMQLESASQKSTVSNAKR